MDSEKVKAILNRIPLDVLIEDYSTDLLTLLRDHGVSTPLEQMLGGNQTIPNNYAIDREHTNFSLSTIPIYTLEAKKQLHPDMDSSKESVPIEAMVIHNPIPSDYSESSLKLLNMIS